MPVTIGEISNTVAVSGEGSSAAPASAAPHTAHHPALHDLDKPRALSAALARREERVACEARARKPRRGTHHA